MEPIASTSTWRDNCVYCHSVCRPRQHCLQCDFCSRWQHRTCHTGINQHFYRRMVKGEVTLDNWACHVCKLTENLPIRAHTSIRELATECTRLDGTAPAPEEPHNASSSQFRDVKTVAPPLRSAISNSVVAQQTSPPRTPAAQRSLEDEIYVLYPEDSPLPLPVRVTPRASGMPLLIDTSPSSSSEELRLYLPETPSFSIMTPRDLTSPTPYDTSGEDSPLPCFSFLQSTPVNRESSSARYSLSQTSPTRTTQFFSSHLSSLQTPRHLTDPAPGVQAEWSTTTDSPFPSPPSVLLSPHNDMYSLPLFLDADEDVESDSDLHSSLAQLKDRLIKELTL